MKKILYPLWIITLIASSCSSHYEIITHVESDSHEAIPGELSTEVQNELSLAYISKSYYSVSPGFDDSSVEIRASKADLEVKYAEMKDLIDISLHYEFEHNNDDSIRTFDLFLNDLNYSKEDGIIKFDSDYAQGIMTLDVLEDSLIYSDVSVKGFISLIKDRLSSGITISGNVKDRPFCIRVDGLTERQPSPVDRYSIIEYICYAKYIFYNKSSKIINVDLISDNKGSFEGLDFTLIPGESYEKLLIDYQSWLCRSISISESGSEKADTVLNWTSPDVGLPLGRNEDFFIYYNDNAGYIAPLYYPVISLVIDDENIALFSGNKKAFFVTD